MVERTCEGGCCAVFWLSEDAKTDPKTEPFIADMIVPLNRRQAVRRWRKFVSKDLPLAQAKGMGRTTYTCRHWDESTRLCTVYDDRPNMCRDYPYGQACSHGCDYQVGAAVAEKYGNGSWEWDEAAKGWRPKSSAYFLWDPEAGVLRPIPEAPEAAA